MSSISEKSGSYISDHHHHHEHHHHRHHHHPVTMPPPPMQTTTEFDEDDEDEEDLRTEALIRGGRSNGSGPPTQSTYLVDHHPQLFEHPVVAANHPQLTNYATMPRGGQQPPLTSTFTNTVGRRPPPPTASIGHYEEEERRRQAYIQSLPPPCHVLIGYCVPRRRHRMRDDASAASC